MSTFPLISNHLFVSAIATGATPERSRPPLHVEADVAGLTVEVLGLTSEIPARAKRTSAAPFTIPSTLNHG